MGVISFFTITLVTHYEKLGFGLQMGVQLFSIMIFMIAFNSITTSGNEVTLGTRNSVTSLAWLWGISTLLTLPYIVLDNSTYVKSIITFDTYVTYLPLFIILGLPLVLIVTQVIKFVIGLREYKGRNCLLSYFLEADLSKVGFLSDYYILSTMVLTHFTSNIFAVAVTIFLLCLALYIYIIRKIIVSHKDTRMSAINKGFVLRNITMFIVLNMALYDAFWSNSQGSFIHWDLLSKRLILVSVISVLLSMGLKNLESKFQTVNVNSKS